MKVLWIAIASLHIAMGTAMAQEAASAASAAQASATASALQPAGSGPLPMPEVADQALRKDIATILATTAKIAKTQEDEGSLLLKVRDGFVTNVLWELFGFKNTEKTVVGQAISILGVLGLVLKAVWFVSRKGDPEPAWARALTYLYLVVVVSVFSLLAFSGGAASEIPASSSAAKPLLDAGVRLEAAADKLLRTHAEAAARAASAPPTTGAAAASQMIGAETLATLRRELSAVAISSDMAAKNAEKAALKPTGWGWHLLITLLLIGVLFFQYLTFDRRSS